MGASLTQQLWGLLLFLCSCAFAMTRIHESRKKLRLPPGPPPWPVVGNIFQMSSLPHRSFWEFSKKYGPLVFLRFGSTKILTVNSAAMAKLVLQTHDNEFSSRPQTSAAMRIVTFGFHDFIMSPYGSRWRQLKKTIVSELFSTKRMSASKPKREEQVTSILKLIKKELEGGKAIDVRQKVYQCFSNIITTMIANKAYLGPEATSLEVFEFSEAVLQLLKIVGSFNPGDHFRFLKPFDVLGLERKLNKYQARLTKFYQKIIHEHRLAKRNTDEGKVLGSEPYVEDFVDILLSCHGLDGENSLSDVTITAIMQDLIIAGTDTSSKSVEWAFAELMRHPEIMKKAQEELDSVVGRDRLVTEDDIPNLKYLDAILRENFRYHPVVATGVPRISPKGGCKLAGYDIPENTMVLMNPWAIGRDPGVWDRPDEFDPDRFMVNNAPDVRGQHFELIPFGSGRRMCTGISLGLLTTHLVLGQLLHSFNWTLPDGQTPESLNFVELPGFTSEFKFPLHVIGTPRLAPGVL